MSLGHCILPKRIQKRRGIAIFEIHPRHCHQRSSAWHFACPGETRSSSTAPWSFSWPWWQLAHGGRCWSDDKDLELMPAAFSHFCHVITTPDALKSSSGFFPIFSAPPFFFLGFLLLHRGFWKITRSTVLQVTGSLDLSWWITWRRAMRWWRPGRCGASSGCAPCCLVSWAPPATPARRLAAPGNVWCETFRRMEMPAIRTPRRVREVGGLHNVDGWLIVDSGWLVDLVKHIQTVESIWSFMMWCKFLCFLVFKICKFHEDVDGSIEILRISVKFETSFWYVDLPGCSMPTTSRSFSVCMRTDLLIGQSLSSLVPFLHRRFTAVELGLTVQQDTDSPMSSKMVPLFSVKRAAKRARPWRRLNLKKCWVF